MRDRNRLHAVNLSARFGIEEHNTGAILVRIANEVVAVVMPLAHCKAALMKLNVTLTKNGQRSGERSADLDR
jgi:hypothetical protein